MKNNFFNSLGFKLLLVNLVAPIILIGGMFLLGGYKQALEESEFKNLETQAELVTASFNNYWLIMQGIKKLTQLRVQIFSTSGGLVLDSKPNEEEHIIKLQDLIATLTEGKITKSIDHEKNIMDVVVPAYSVNEEIIGAIRVFASAQDLNNRVMATKRVIFILSGITLFITVILSLFFAKNLIYPLNELAEIANQIDSRTQPIEIPDYSKRKDEVGRLSCAFNSMMTSINKKLNTFESFASDVTHEIKNPLTSILNATQTIQKIDDQEKKDKLINIIANDVERLNRLITDISSLSKISAEVDQERLEKIAIIPLIEELSKLYQFNDNDIKIDIQYPTGLKNAKILGKDTRISQIFNNLIGNALSFSEPNSTITIDIKRSKNQLVISVIDTGSGFPKGKEKQLFDRFYTDRKQEHSHKHSGLGLSLSKTIIDSMGGKIYAKHNEPKGAIFTFELPIIIEKR